MRTIATLEPIWDLQLTSLIICHDHYVTFQMAEVTIPRQLFADISQLNIGLQPLPIHHRREWSGCHALSTRMPSSEASSVVLRLITGRS